MYRILIRSVNVNISSLNWVTVSVGSHSNIWETENEQEALDEYQKQLKMHSANNLTLFHVVPISISVTSPKKEEEKEEEREKEEESGKDPEPDPDPAPDDDSDDKHDPDDPDDP